MALFRLYYGDLPRPPCRILRSRGWGQCTNLTDEYIIVYGPKHLEERSIFRYIALRVATGSDYAGQLGLRRILCSFGSLAQAMAR
jgi:hypothetical protein